MTLNALTKALVTPTGLALGLSALPSMEEIGDKGLERYERYARGLVEMPYEKPGDTGMNISAFPFVEKRGALQEKMAAWDFPAANLNEQGVRPLDRVQQPTGIPGVPPGLLGGNFGLLGGIGLDIGEVGRPLAETWGYKLRKALGVGLMTRTKADETIAAEYAKSLGKNLGSKTIDLLADVASKALGAPAHAMQAHAYAQIFNVLRKEDPLLAEADPKMLTDAYHTMVRFAPTLSTDKNAVKAFLRESVTYGTGPNHVAIKQLADAEQSVNKALHPEA